MAQLPKRLSRYFTLNRLVHSDMALARGIDNMPHPEVLPNLKLLARGLDQVRRLLGHPLDISSGYRSPVLNAAVGGVPGSQHTLGLAADFICPDFGPPIEVARAIRNSPIDFDQCVLEFGEWVHLSFSAAPRRRVLTIYAAAEGYLEGLVDEARRLVA
jgi:zinc D-Ala-D-Ala carboxypeptidase